MVDYVAKIRRHNWEGLQELSEKIKARHTPGWPAGKAFEHLILRAFELSGVDVTWPYEVTQNGYTVEQIDGMIVAGPLICLIESKDRNANLSIEPIAKLRNQLLRRPAGTIGCVFSSSGFTDPAKTLAHYTAPQAILLWSGPEIEHLLTTVRDFSRALKRKYTILIQNATPEFDIRADDVP